MQVLFLSKSIIFNYLLKTLGLKTLKSSRKVGNMSIAQFVVIQCDVQSCGHKTPMLDLDPCFDGNDEQIRAKEGFSFVDIPFKDQVNLYICQKCLSAIFGIFPKG